MFALTAGRGPHGGSEAVATLTTTDEGREKEEGTAAAAKATTSGGRGMVAGRQLPARPRVTAEVQVGVGWAESGRGRRTTSPPSRHTS